MKFKKLSTKTINVILNRLPPEYHYKIRPILKRVKVEPERGCWFINEDWSHYTTLNKERGHRYIYRILRGPIEGSLVCHNCDRRGCINPDHLFRGTSGDNYQDAVNKHRARPLGKLFNKSKELGKLKELDRWKRLRYVTAEFAYATRSSKR